MTFESYEQDFLLRYRLPRPVSLAYESVCLAADRGDLAFRCRWCARVALRFLAALRQAARLAVQQGGPVNPPSLTDLRAPIPTGGPGWAQVEAFARMLEAIDPRPLERLIDAERAPEVDCASLREALLALLPLARYRLVVVAADHFDVLLGPHIEYPATGGSSVPMPPTLPAGVPLFVDPATGWFLVLAPLLVWEKRAQDAFGHLYLLRRVEQQEGHYIEDGVPGSPGCSRALGGAPGTGELPAMQELLRVIQSPPARFQDGSELPAYGRVLGLIWRGGTSDVFVARRGEEVRPVALKTFRYEEGILDENFWRFLGEERFSQAIEHPAVVVSRRIPPGPWGIVHEQELAGRGSLSDKLAVNGVLPVDRAVDIAIALLDVLAAVHARGIVHNDVKPDNLLFDDQHALKLIDFGIAGESGDRAGVLLPGVPAGTRGYMAPELHAGGLPTPASDLYSAGVVLAEMVTGVKPEAEGPLRALAEIAAPLGELLARLLAAEPGQRFAGAAEAAAALRAVRGKLTPARAVTLDIEGSLIPGYGIWQARPLSAEFLAFCLEHFDRLFVYTLLDRAEAEAVFEELVRQGAAPSEFLRRYEYVEWPRGADGSLKDLRRCRVPLDRNAIVDDMERWIPEDQLDRWIPVRDFNEVRGVDRDLARAMEALRERFGLPGAVAAASAREARPS